MDEIPEDMSRLIDHVVRSAGTFIANRGGFYPFGAAIRAGTGELQAMLAFADPNWENEPVDPVATKEALHEVLRSDVALGKLRAVCAATDGAMQGKDGSPVDIVVMRLETERDEPLLLVLPYFQQDGEWIFGELGRMEYGDPIFFPTSQTAP